MVLSDDKIFLVLLCVFFCFMARYWGIVTVPGLPYERAKGVRTHISEYLAYLLTLSPLRQPGVIRFSQVTWRRREVRLQPVPWKMRLEIVKEMQIKIMNGGEILVNCKFKFNQNLFEFVRKKFSAFKSNQNLNSTLYHEIPRNLIFSNLTS